MTKEKLTRLLVEALEQELLADPAGDIATVEAATGPLIAVVDKHNKTFHIFVRDLTE